MTIWQVLLSIVVSIASVEVLGISRWLAYKLIKRSVQFLPAEKQKRWEEEWLAELERLHRFGFYLPQLGYAISVYFGAPKLGLVIRNIIQSTDKFSFLTYLCGVVLFQFLRVLDSTVWFVARRTKELDSQKKVLELWGLVVAAKILYGNRFAPKWYRKFYKDKQKIEHANAGVKESSSKEKA